MDFNPDKNYQGMAIQQLASLRDGKGIVFTKSAGNGYQRAFDFNRLAMMMDCSRANQAKVTCENANAEPEQAMPQYLVVGAANASGTRASYSSAGSNILVMGLGGEPGFPVPDDITGIVSTSPAIVTTDLAGCSRGSVKSNVSSKNALNDPTSAVHASLNPNCDYMATMNGTSAAAPTIAGVVALMFQANPNLTWRDVRYILMKTARQIDASRAPNTVKLPSGESYVPEPAWTRNAPDSGSTIGMVSDLRTPPLRWRWRRRTGRT
ncbi:hypothetical protein AU476_24405 [Cupriavidus sp. UYMSc13B]|nr:hypothetical protein AU476_24405 [Cupriavidus sp. UYMSc13B]